MGGPAPHPPPDRAPDERPAQHRPLILAACSGGADSLALTAALGFVAPRLELRAAAVVVDHGLQADSAAVAARASEQCRGLLPHGSTVEVVRAHVSGGPGGPESRARDARYAALAATAARLGAIALLLGHTRDDQAEQVLLGLARGSGTRSLAGMPSTRLLSRAGGREGPRGAVGGQEVLLGRPFLGGRGAGDRGSLPGWPGMTREQTRQACVDLGLVPWSDPHNDDPRFARVRARRALVELEPVLGDGLADNLARSADLLRDDGEALDAWAETAYLELGEPPWSVAELAPLPRAIRTRVWRRRALDAGSPGTDLTSEHLLAVDELLTGWRGQGPLHLPGGVRAGRSGDRVWLEGEA